MKRKKLALSNLKKNLVDFKVLTKKQMISDKSEFKKNGGDSQLDIDFEAIDGKLCKTRDGLAMKVLPGGIKVVKRPRELGKDPTLEVRQRDSFFQSYAKGKKNIKSGSVKDVFYEEWQTYILENKEIRLLSIMHCHERINFILKADNNGKIFLLAIEQGSPYRVIPEEIGHSAVDKYFRSPTKRKNRKDHDAFTWKMWGTSFIKDMDSGSQYLSNYELKRNKNICQYLIRAQGEYIEFISNPPSWKIFYDSSLAEVFEFCEKDDWIQI